jgi:hypothetical protein
MSESAFTDESKRPDDAELAVILGGAKRHWDNLLSRIQRDHPRAKAEWKHYSTGWRLIIKEPRRNLAYLNPLRKHFVVSFALSDEAVDAAERSELPVPILEALRASKKFPEGRAARIDVASARDVAHAGALFSIKIAH